MAPRVDVLGVGISCVDLARTVDIFEDWITAGAREYVCVTGMHGVMESQTDPELRSIHNRSGLTTPDGMPMVWSGRWAGGDISRVYGPELMLAVLSRAVERGWSSYFLGAQPDVIESLLAVLRARVGDLKVAGWACPPFREIEDEETAALVRSINETGPDIVWVALGTPKQERWMAAQRDVLEAPVLVGVGAAFALLSGAVPQAPRWLRRAGLEWLFRLAVEPRRLWRRYVLGVPRFAVALLGRRPRMVTGRSPTGDVTSP